jgi:predicted phosphoribosyltransferase
MSVTAQFQDRSEAGRLLAAKLGHHAGKPAVVVLGLPRGGVPVACEVAGILNVPLDIFLVRGLGAPGYDEMVIGTVASRGVKILDREVVERLGISEEAAEATARAEQRELERQESIYRDGREPVALKDQTVILVDEGLATGSCIRAAVRALREREPKSITVAVPVGSPDTCRQMRSEADEVVCAMTPEPFFSVGTWYADFMEIPDEEITRLLKHAAHQRRAREARAKSDRLSIQEDIMA